MASIRTGLFGTYYGSLYLSSEYLSTAEMETNARYINKYFLNNGWSQNAIAGMLGNMQAESGFNPGIWQSNDVGNTSGGFGLVQWTPATKYFEWCESRNLSDPSEMDNNLARIQYEVDNGLQWITRDDYPISFKQFATSNQSVSYLAKAFLLNYERPADQSIEKQNLRASYAENWYMFLTGQTPGSGGDSPGSGSIVVAMPKRNKYNFVLFNRRRRMYQ